MATEQFNLRIKPALAQSVRDEAHRLGCKPRDVIEDLIATASFSPIAGTPEPPMPGQTTIVEVVEANRDTGDAELVETRACPDCSDPMIYHEDADVWACDGCGHSEAG